jgi:glycerol uptake facilitator-like aquaporin
MYLGLSLMVVEFLAAFVAGGLFLVIHPDVHGIDGRRIIFHPGIGVSDLTAIFTELIASAILVMTALRYCEDDVECFDDTACAYIRQNLILRNAFRSIALGFTRGYLFLPAKFTSLAAYNTAEVLSVCVISQQCSKIWIYFIGDFGGALLAGLFNYIFLFG